MNELEYVRHRAAMLINYNPETKTYHTQQGNFDFVDENDFSDPILEWNTKELLQNGIFYPKESAECAAKLWANLCNNSILWLRHWGILLESFTFFVDFGFHNCEIQWVNNNTGAMIKMRNVVFDNYGTIKSAYIILENSNSIQ